MFAHVGERRAALTAALAGVGGGASDAEIDAAAALFDLPLENLAAAAADGTRRGVPLWSACRAQTRSAVRDLARVVRPRATWDDLVPPAAHTEQLHALVARSGHRGRVLDGWGFGGRTTRGRGTTALFAGPSGTGKTLAAEVVAGELGLDLYRVDLRRW